MLKSDCVSFEIVPVSGYDDLSELARLRVKGNTEVRFVLFVYFSVCIQCIFIHLRYYYYPIDITECFHHPHIDTQLKSIIMINVGGVIDIEEFFSPLPSQVKIFVIDSHRPLELANLFKSEQVVVLDDGEVDEDLGEVQEAYQNLEVCMLFFYVLILLSNCFPKIFLFD